jgi:signal transduction histidine kinase
VLHAIADHVVDGYLAVADAMQDDIDEVETEVFSPGRGGVSRGVDSARIYQLKREVLEFKRAVSPLLRPMQLLSERPMRLIDPDIQKYFRDVADHLARVQEQVQRLQRLVDDLLEVERLQEGKLQLERAVVDLVPLVQGLVEAMQAATDGPRVDLAVAEEPLVVAGDVTRLSQVVLNLLTNAVKYAADSERIDVRLRREAGEATLEVQDYGPGIPDAALPHLFDRFYQAARRTAEDGLGVGLFITRELVRAHGGAIEVRSSEGAGATFTVRLPLLEAPEAARPTSTP